MPWGDDRHGLPDLSETELSRELTDLLCIMLGHYKGVRSEAELGPWLEKARHLIS